MLFKSLSAWVGFLLLFALFGCTESASSKSNLNTPKELVNPLKNRQLVGEALIWLVAKGKIDKEVFSQRFGSLFVTKFYPRANALIHLLFNYFTTAELANIYSALLPIFNEKLAWFYIGDGKKELLPAHLNILAQELLYYLAYLRNTNADLGRRRSKIINRSNSIKSAWLKNHKERQVYFDLVLTAYCYQIRRIAALILQWEYDFASMLLIVDDPLPKARILLGELSSSPYHEQATSIFKSYEGILTNALKSLYPRSASTKS